MKKKISVTLPIDVINEFAEQICEDVKKRVTETLAVYTESKIDNFIKAFTNMGYDVFIQIKDGEKIPLIQFIEKNNEPISTDPSE